MTMTRYKAAALHFTGSAFVLLLIFALVRWVWYPGPLFFAASGVNLLGIISSVDVVLGPLIMLIIFDVKKKSLKFDIGVILICQISFMVYGAMSIFEARPVYLVFAKNRFHVVTANQLEPSNLNKVTRAEFKDLPWFGPKLVGTEEPQDAKEREAVMLATSAIYGIQHMPQYYVPYDARVMAQVKASAAAWATSTRVTNDDQKRWAEYRQAKPKPAVLFIPLVAKAPSLFAAIDPQTGAVLEFF
jgi:hypothetical protein